MRKFLTTLLCLCIIMVFSFETVGTAFALDSVTVNDITVDWAVSNTKEHVDSNYHYKGIITSFKEEDGEEITGSALSDFTKYEVEFVMMADTSDTNATFASPLNFGITEDDITLVEKSVQLSNDLRTATGTIVFYPGKTTNVKDSLFIDMVNQKPCNIGNTAYVSYLPEGIEFDYYWYSKDGNGVSTLRASGTDSRYVLTEEDYGTHIYVVGEIKNNTNNLRYSVSSLTSSELGPVGNNISNIQVSDWTYGEKVYATRLNLANNFQEKIQGRPINVEITAASNQNQTFLSAQNITVASLTDENWLNENFPRSAGDYKIKVTGYDANSNLFVGEDSFTINKFELSKLNFKWEKAADAFTTSTNGAIIKTNDIWLSSDSNGIVYDGYEKVITAVKHDSLSEYYHGDFRGVDITGNDFEIESPSSQFTRHNKDVNSNGYIANVNSKAGTNFTGTAEVKYSINPMLLNYVSTTSLPNRVSKAYDGTNTIAFSGYDLYYNKITLNEDGSVGRAWTKYTDPYSLYAVTSSTDVADGYLANVNASVNNSNFSTHDAERFSDNPSWFGTEYTSNTDRRPHIVADIKNTDKKLSFEKYYVTSTDYGVISDGASHTSVVALRYGDSIGTDTNNVLQGLVPDLYEKHAYYGGDKWEKITNDLAISYSSNNANVVSVPNANQPVFTVIGCGVATIRAEASGYAAELRVLVLPRMLKLATPLELYKYYDGSMIASGKLFGDVNTFIQDDQFFKKQKNSKNVDLSYSIPDNKSFSDASVGTTAHFYLTVGLAGNEKNNYCFEYPTSSPITYDQLNSIALGNTPVVREKTLTGNDSIATIINSQEIITRVDYSLDGNNWRTLTSGTDVKGNINVNTFVTEKDRTYSGNSIKPFDGATFKLFADSEVVIESYNPNHMTLEYGTNINAGVGTLTLKGNNYKFNDIVFEFNILPRPISFKANVEEKVYDGSASAMLKSVAGTNVKNVVFDYSVSKYGQMADNASLTNADIEVAASFTDSGYSSNDVNAKKNHPAMIVVKLNSSENAKNYIFATETAGSEYTVDVNNKGISYKKTTETNILYKGIQYSATVSNKVYDGNVNSSITNFVVAMSDNISVPNEYLLVEDSFGHATFTDASYTSGLKNIDAIALFDNKDASKNSNNRAKVYATLSNINENLARNYTFGSNSDTRVDSAEITTAAYIYFKKVNISFASVSNKVYNGNTETTVKDIVFTQNGAAVESDTVASMSNYKLKGYFENKNASETNLKAKVVATMSDALKNFTFGEEAPGKARVDATTTDYDYEAYILFKKLTVPTVTSLDKVYDGKKNAEVNVEFAGLVDGESLSSNTDYSITASFTDCDAGANKAIGVHIALIDNETTRNYTFADQGESPLKVAATDTNSQADIFYSPVYVEATVLDKNYDGRKYMGKTSSIRGILASDSSVATLDIDEPTWDMASNTNYGVFAVANDANAGSKTVTVTVRLNASGTDANEFAKNYTLVTSTSLIDTTRSLDHVRELVCTATNINIKYLPLPLFFTVNDKDYDGNANMPISAHLDKSFALENEKDSITDTDFEYKAVANDEKTGTKNVTVTAERKDTYNEVLRNYSVGAATATNSGNNELFATVTNAKINAKSNGGGGFGGGGFIPVTTSYKITFNMGGHGTFIAAQTVKKGEKAKMPTEPKAEGFIFEGWYTGQDYVTLFDFNTAITKDTVVYAKWVEEEKFDVLEAIKNVKLMARTAYTAKNNTQITVSVTEGLEDFAKIQEKYTVEYKFCRSIYSNKQYKKQFITTNTVYTNTKGVKGQKYYYKVVLLVKDTEGNVIAKTELKDCKYGARIYKGKVQE